MSLPTCTCKTVTHKHGHHRMRITHGCTCEPCSEAYIAYNRRRRASALERALAGEVSPRQDRRVVELQCRVELPPKQRTTMRDLDGERFVVAYLHYEIAPSGDGGYSRVAFALDNKCEPRRGFTRPGKTKGPWPQQLPPPPKWFTTLIEAQMT